MSSKRITRSLQAKSPVASRFANLTGRLLQGLEAEKDRKPHAPLPSIRSLARHFGVSANTVQKAFRTLSARGEAYGIPGKGYYWGKGPAAFPALPQRVADAPDRIAEALKEDMRAGALDPFASLPAQKSLSDRYRVSTRTLRKALATLEKDGVLERAGRTYRFKTGPSAPPGSMVILITRCDPFGRLLLDSERELDFLKAAHIETRALQLELQVTGYSPKGGTLDRQGRKVPLIPSGRPVLGVLVSTWLAPDVLGILALLRPHRLPISVWWEHSSEAISRTRFPRNAVLFNSAFGERPGALVAETLLSLGHRHVVFLSPFHASAWSQQRLDGLRKRMMKTPGGRVTAMTDDTHASPWSYQEEAWKQLRVGNRNLEADDSKVKQRKFRNLTRRVLNMLASGLRDTDATAWVCVNDEVAEIVSGYFRQLGSSPAPFLISFDNTAASYRLGIDSFAFDARALARAMLFHLTRPAGAFFSGQELVDLEGRVERK